MSNTRYRVVMMMPTEMYIDGPDLESVTYTASWMMENHEPVEFPISSANDPITSNALPYVLSIEETDIDPEKDVDTKEPV